MAGSSFFKYFRKAFGTMAIIIPVLALSGCGEGDGPTRILNAAATPLPPGFVAPAPTLGVFSETNADQIVIIQDIQQAGNEVLISTERVRVFEGEIALGLSYTSGAQGFGGATILFEDADVSPYNTLKFSIDTSSFANFANLTVQLEPPGGGTAGAFVALADYIPVATEGDWETYEIPLSAFPAVNLALVNKLGFFNARDGSDALLAGTLYLDDIHFTVTDLGGSGGAVGTPIDPEVVLYATEGELDLVIPDDYDDVTGLGSGSVPNLNYADDDTYSKVLSVFSGIIDDTNVAQVGFIGFDPGFVTFYEDLVFKIKGMPNFVVFVTLYEDGDPVRINLSSSAYSRALGNDWFQVSIPLSSFTGLTTATGIAFESDDTAQMQFNMFLTDIGFSGDGTGGPGPGPGPGQESLGVFSETNTDPVVTITDIVSAGNTVTIDGESTAVTPFDGAESLALTYSTGGAGFGGAIFEFEDADLSAYAKLKFSIDTSVFANFADLTVQLEPPPGGSGPGNFVFLSAYTPVATSGNWDTYEIALTDFTTVSLSLVNKLGFFNARDGSDVLLAGTLYLDDIHFITAGGPGPGPGPGGGVAGDITINGGFETGAFNDGSENASWQQFPGGSSTQAITTVNPHSGTYAANLNIPVLGAGDPPVDNLIKNANLEAGNLTPGASVTVTFWMRGTLEGAGGVVFAELFSELDGGGTSKAEILSGGPIFPNEAWTEYSYDTTLGPDVAGGVTLQLKVGCGPEGCGADVYFDDVSVVIN